LKSALRLTTAVVLLSAVVSAQGWVTTAVETLTANSNRKSVGAQALAADNSGAVHALWAEQAGTGPRRILYARKPADSAWAPSTVVAESAGGVPSLAVDPATGTAHAAWCGRWAGPQDALYASNRSGQWQVANLTNDTTTTYSATIALDAAGCPHVAWITRDSTRAWRIACAESTGARWASQTLFGSQLGDFGSGAAPYLTVSPTGIAHITYRGGNYPDYRVHHAENAAPGDTTWAYEELGTPNQADYSSGIAALTGEELLLVISGNDGWGMPFHTYYLHRPAGTNVWDSPRLMTADASAALRSFTQLEGRVHITWEEISGNINTERIFHCWLRPDQLFFNSAVRADGQTSGGAIALSPDRAGHCLVVTGPTPDAAQVYCLHSQPFTALSSEPVSRLAPRRPLIGSAPLRLDGLAGPVRIVDASGRLIRALTGRDASWDGRDRSGNPVSPGTLFAVDRTGVCRITLLR
jgi:hypothetical protein